MSTEEIFKTINNPIKRFKVGSNYEVRSAGDHNCIYYYRVVKRTSVSDQTRRVHSVWLKEGRSPEWLDSLTTEQRSHDVTRRKIDTFQNVETCFPEGKYSMAPILKADSPCVRDEPEQGKTYALTGAKGTPNIAAGNNWAESEVKPERTVKEMYHFLFTAAHLVLDGADKALSVGIGSPGHEPKGIEELRAAVAALEGK